MVSDLSGEVEEGFLGRRVLLPQVFDVSTMSSRSTLCHYIITRLCGFGAVS